MPSYKTNIMKNLKSYQATASIAMGLIVTAICMLSAYVVWENYTWASFVCSLLMHGVAGLLVAVFTANIFRFINTRISPAKTMEQVAEWISDKGFSLTFHSAEITGFLRNWYTMEEIREADMCFHWQSGTKGKTTFEDFLEWWKS